MHSLHTQRISLYKLCRLGSGRVPRPFSSCTFVRDFSAHRHHDRNNLRNGVTAAVTLRQPGLEGLPCDQYHLMTNYSLTAGSKKGNLALDLPSGSVLVTHAFRLVHATTAVKDPCRKWPKRCACILIQHIKLDLPLHGQAACRASLLGKSEAEVARLKQQGFPDAS